MTPNDHITLFLLLQTPLLPVMLVVALGLAMENQP